MQSANTTWLELLHWVKEQPDQPSRDGNCRELVGVQCRIDPRFAVITSLKRRMNPVYAAAEMLWYMSGTPLISMIAFYAPQYQRFAESSPEGNYAWGAYGWRWSGGSHSLEAEKARYARTLKGQGSSTWAPDAARDFEKKCWTTDSEKITQTLLALMALERSPLTRQAVLTCYDAGDLMHAVSGDKKDIPCTLNMQFINRADGLSLITSMRSNDLWLGFPYDVFCFTTLQRLFAYVLDVKCGVYVHNVGSLHLYTRDETKGGPDIAAAPAPHGDRDYDEYLLPGRDTRERYYSLGAQLNAAIDAERGFREKGWRTLDMDSLEREVPCPALRDLVVLCASKSVPIDPEWIVSPALRVCFEHVDPRRS